MATTRRKRSFPRSRLDARALVLAGIVAGTLFLVLEVLTALAFGAHTPFGPAYVTLRGLAGAEGLPGERDPALVLTSLFVHYLLSVLVIVPLAGFVHRWRQMYRVAAVGFVYGYTLYFVNFILFAFALPLLATARDLFMLVHYSLFGMAAAWLYAVRVAWHAGRRLHERTPA